MKIFIATLLLGGICLGLGAIHPGLGVAGACYFLLAAIIPR